MNGLDLSDQQLYFEVVDYKAARSLTMRLGQTRTAALLGEDPYVVVAAISSEPSDLAVLLRIVESWVRDESLCAIRFLLDDRLYVLEAGGADWKSHPWAAPLEEVDESPSAA